MTAVSYPKPQRAPREPKRLKRKTPLPRTGDLSRSPIKHQRSRRVERKSEADAAFSAWVHTQPCAGATVVRGHDCAGPIEQAHARNIDGVTGLGRKESDRNSIPLCRSLHRQYDGHRGRFVGWSRERRRCWIVARIIEVNARYEIETAAEARRRT